MFLKFYLFIEVCHFSNNETSELWTIKNSHLTTFSQYESLHLNTALKPWLWLSFLDLENLIRKKEKKKKKKEYWIIDRGNLISNFKL